MKNIFILIAAMAFFSSCEKDLPTYISFEAYEFASLDENGGTWDPILLDSATQIGIPTPEDVTSPSYLAELADLKAAASGASADELEIVEYWSSNSLIRWNEIARELAAKYNLAPAPNPDGTYSAPDPANPSNYPNFPFAHPPYACRMFAYWGTAQFDALIAAWQYKYQYNRPAAYEVDGSIETHLPENGLPGYPSEGAVIAAVSKSILTAMFPLEKDFIAEKAAEHFNSLHWAGMNVESEIAAGDSLGRAVAAVFLNRAKNDGMKNAQAPRPVSDSLKAAAQAQWGWQWDNLEDPPRPVGITPLFGRVKPWCIPNVEAVRPVPPPAPGSAEFQKDAEELQEIADNLTPEQRKIANFWADGLGTYTPPGHWNRFAGDLMIKYRENPLRSARTFAYLNMAVMDAGISCWDAKYYYHYPRPSQAIPGFKTILGIPNFPSYTSGHSTFSAAAAAVLSHIYPADQAQSEAWADEAAESRIYAGIHYRFDAEVGNVQGKAVASYTIEVAEKDGAQ
ncbi:MAG: phosphatase PAP2 family protein [Saprospirales bacterium]|nr:phosphatase PAP2 family protein [Saprospirales bacterium]MBK7335462.1 phosphatase PAP2 family protein [Saprospirales bacterium]